MQQEVFLRNMKELMLRFGEVPVSRSVLVDRLNYVKGYSSEEFQNLINGLLSGKATQPAGWVQALAHLANTDQLEFLQSGKSPAPRADTNVVSIRERSTANLGEQLEQEVFEYLRSYFVSRDLGLKSSAKYAVCRKKRYASAVRGRTIEVDASVELFLGSQTRPSLIWVWECKDYGRLVTVETVEEFDSKLRQIGEHNTKGTIVTRRGFSSTAISLAKNYGIGLLRMIAPDKMEIIAHTTAGVDIKRMKEAACETMMIESNQHSFYGVGALTTGGAWLAVENLPLPDHPTPSSSAGLMEYLALELHDAIPQPVPTACDLCMKTPPKRRLMVHQEISVNGHDYVPLISSYALCSWCHLALVMAVAGTRLLAALFLVSTLAGPALYAMLPNLLHVYGKVLTVTGGAYVVAMFLFLAKLRKEPWYDQWVLKLLMSRHQEQSQVSTHLVQWADLGTRRGTKRLDQLAIGELRPNLVLLYVRDSHESASRIAWLFRFAFPSVFTLLLGVSMVVVAMGLGNTWRPPPQPTTWQLVLFASLCAMGIPGILVGIVNLSNEKINSAHSRGFIIRYLLWGVALKWMYALYPPPPLARSWDD